MNKHLKQLEDEVENRCSDFPGVVAESTQFIVDSPKSVRTYIFEPGDATRYIIFISPLTTRMALATGYNAQQDVYMVTCSIRWRSFPLNFSQEFGPERIPYIMEKFEYNEYTSAVICKFLEVIRQVINKEAEYGIRSIHDLYPRSVT